MPAADKFRTDDHCIAPAERIPIGVPVGIPIGIPIRVCCSTADHRGPEAGL
jgi:hypothetical protein